MCRTLWTPCTLNTLYWKYFHCSGFLSNLRLPWKTKFFLKIFTVWNIFLTIQDFWTTLRLPWKTELALKFFTVFIQDFWATCACPEFVVLNIYIFFTVTCGEVGDWAGTVSFKAKFTSVWIEWNSINSPLNWLLAEWLLLMISIPYHNLLHTYRYNGDSRFEKSNKLKWLVTYLFNGFTEKLKQSYNLCIRSEFMQWSNWECRPLVWSAAAENFNEIWKVKARLRAGLQITSVQQDRKSVV